MRDAAMEGSRNLAHLGFFDTHMNRSTRVASIFTSVTNAATATEMVTLIHCFEAALKSAKIVKN